MNFTKALFHPLLLFGLLLLSPASAFAASAPSPPDWHGRVQQALRAGQTKAAIAIAEKGIRALGETHPMDALVLLLDESQAYKGLGDLHGQGGALNRATTIVTQSLNLNDPKAYDVVGFIFIDAGRTAMVLNDTPIAIGHLETAMRMAKAGGKTDDDTSGVLGTLGVLYQGSGRLDEAAQYLERAIAAIQRAGRSAADPSPLLRALATTYESLGQIQKGAPYALRLVNTLQNRLKAEPQKDQYDDLQTLLSVGPLLRELGQYQVAEVIYLQALDLYSTNFADRQRDLVDIRDSLGSLYAAMGRGDEAEAEYKTAIALAERFNDQTLLGTMLSNLGDVYRNTGHNKEAIVMLKRALTSYEGGKPSSDPMGRATTLLNLSLALLDDGQFNEAEPYAQQSLDIMQKAFPSGHFEIGSVLQALSDVRRQQGRLRESLEFNQRIIDERLKFVDPEHEDVARAYNNRAILLSALNDKDQALDYFRKAEAIDDKNLPEGHADRISVHTNIALELLPLKRRDEAVREAGLGAEQAASAMRTASQARASPNALDLWEAAFELFLATRYDASADRQPIPPQAFEMAQWATSSDAGWALQQMSARQADGAANLQTLIRKRQDLMSDRDQVNSALTDTLSSTGPGSAEAARQQGQRMLAIDSELKSLDATIARDFPKFSDLALPLPASLADTAALLKNDEALVLILATREFETADLSAGVQIFVVTHSDSLWSRSDFDPEAIGGMVGTLRCGLDVAAWSSGNCPELTGQSYTETDFAAGKPLPFDHLLAYRLYHALLGGAEDLIRGKRLLIVPSGPLTQLPFQALITAPPASKSDVAAAWLIRDHALTVLPAASSLRALRALSRPSSARKPVIGFGDPLLDGDPNNPEDRKDADRAREAQSCSGLRHDRVRMASAKGTHRGLAPIATGGGSAEASFIRAQVPLPETADEVCGVARALNADPADVRLGARATVSEVEALSESGRLADYRILLFATHGALAGQIARSAEPGLILTPPAEPSDGDNGYLTASAIAGLKLDADWVVLSACNTASGGVNNAEALSGLARAFFYAQARGMLVSHWEVDSEAAVKLITGATTRLAGNPAMGYAEAMRESMLAVIDDGVPDDAQPSYWAAFVVVGEGGTPN